MNPPALFFLYAGTVLILLSLLQFVRNRFQGSLLLLFLGAVCLFVFAGLLDPFLNLWDERFHALVAKNLLKHPLKPTLYDDPVVPMAYDRWDRFHIWLHKQPLFLWQIALSFRIFGISEFTLRLPSILISSGMVLLLYRIGKITVDERTGYIAAFLFVTSGFAISLVSGRQELEHNDIAFLFYITASLWSFCEYSRSGKWYWALLTGVMSGCAVLCKWLAGLLVYVPWMIWIMGERGSVKKHLFHFILSFLVMLCMVLPWQFLIFTRYPAEAEANLALNAKHIITAVDGHKGNALYYLDHFKELYGRTTIWLVVPALVLLGIQFRDRRIRWAFLAAPVFIYLFFTLAVTKMVTFPYIVSPFIYLAFAASLVWIFDSIQRWNIRGSWLRGAMLVVLITLGVLNFDYAGTRRTHALDDPENSYSAILSGNKAFFTSLASKLPPNAVVFNVKGRHYAECMFYTGLPAYNFFPTQEQCRGLKEKDRLIAIIDDPNTNVPSWLRADPCVIFVKGSVQGWD